MELLWPTRPVGRLLDKDLKDDTDDGRDGQAYLHLDESERPRHVTSGVAAWRSASSHATETGGVLQETSWSSRCTVATLYLEGAEKRFYNSPGNILVFALRLQHCITKGAQKRFSPSVRAARSKLRGVFVEGGNELVSLDLISGRAAFQTGLHIPASVELLDPSSSS